jgi:5'-nucleotidase
MRILVTNDDGINAPGIGVLQMIASSLSDDVWVVAPETEQSCAAHSLSLRRPLRIRSITERHFAVDGTPTDCVLLAIKEIIKDKKPDLLLSGINRGSNLGEDVTYSGTIAAAMEGTLLDVPSIALSQAIAPNMPVKWEVPEMLAAEVITQIIRETIPANTLINLNFPNVELNQVKGVIVAPQGKRKLGDNLHKNFDPDGNPYYWIGAMRNLEKDPPDSDFAAISSGYIAMTPICLDLTNYTVLEQFKQQFSRDF